MKVVKSPIYCYKYLRDTQNKQKKYDIKSSDHGISEIKMQGS